ncbi:MAG: hypothetical protein IJH43_06695 [Mogibacterium sp.]|nr:hypothetical protein [Mogibacterium sp.]
MKIIDADGITYIDLVPCGTDEWYYGISYEHGDLYEAEEVFRQGEEVKGRTLCLIHYPDGKVYRPVPKEKGNYSAEPVYYDGGIFILNVDFPGGLMQIIRFSCSTQKAEVIDTLPLDSIKDCYNLRLDIAPLTLTRQCVGTNEFEIVWPEKVCFEMGDHDSFFLRDGDRLYFSRWHEEGDGPDYRYWEETVVMDLDGQVTDILPGDLRVMPNGELWYLQAR